MRILAIGDLVGEGGVKKLAEELPKIKEQEKIDFIIVNAENSAGGMGITTQIYNKLCELGVNVMTMGNHTWGKKDIFTVIDNENIIRPANYSEKTPGHGYGIYNCKNKKICVINLIGRTDMGVLSENPFLKVKKIIKSVEEKVDIIVIDFHAEATAEKIAMASYLDGKITALFGTHTHVQTADEQILDNGTAYITDIGMTGPIKSVIGMDVEVSFKRFVNCLPERYKTAEGKAKLNSCIFDINDETRKVVNVKRVNL